MPIQLRTARGADISAISRLRAQIWGSKPYWQERISGYLSGEHNPQKALPTRTVVVAEEVGRIVGFVAGHLTRRFECDGELEWINVDEQQRGKGIAGSLMVHIGAWFVAQNATRVCVNVDPANDIARRLYSRHGAKPLNEYWMIWEDADRMLRIDEASAD